LIGDSVDNIPGVDGLGAKGAATLLQTHGTLDAILANPDAVKPERIREKLKAARAQIEQNREMVRLEKDLPLPVPLCELTIRPRYREFIAVLAECEFKSLLAEVEAEYIRNVLASVNGNRTRAAEILGIDRKTLREKLKELGLKMLKYFLMSFLII
jgi:5'-3' exonuclease